MEFADLLQVEGVSWHYTQLWPRQYFWDLFFIQLMPRLICVYQREVSLTPPLSDHHSDGVWSGRYTISNPTRNGCEE